MALVVAADRADGALAALAASDHRATVIGVVVDDGPGVRYR
jgi:hypothetical protein